MIKKVLRFGIKLSVVIVAFLIGALLILKAPEFHASYIKSKVGSQVVLITNETGDHGGTGFAVKTPSGKVMTLTNSHICDIADGKIFAQVGNRRIPLQIIEKSKTSDLCLTSGLAGKSGLEIANSIEVGQQIGSVGHPHLYPLALNRGEYIGDLNVYIDIGQIKSAEDEQSCLANNGKVANVFIFFVCVKKYIGSMTTVVTLPGNSGSPIVNFWGNVVGVIFAGDSSSNWGIMVRFKDIKEFLKVY